MCDLKVIDVPSILRLIRSVTFLTRMWSTLDLVVRRTPHGESERLIVLDELLKLEEIGQFPDDPLKIEGTQIHRGDDQTY